MKLPSDLPACSTSIFADQRPGSSEAFGGLGERHGVIGDGISARRAVGREPRTTSESKSLLEIMGFGFPSSVGAGYSTSTNSTASTPGPYRVARASRPEPRPRTASRTLGPRGSRERLRVVLDVDDMLLAAEKIMSSGM